MTLVEKGLLGGTCVHVGCVPSKALLRSAEALHRAAHHPFAGVQTRAEGASLSAIAEQRDALIAQLQREKYASVLQSAGVSLIRGAASFLSPESLSVQGKTYRADKFLLATGSLAAWPDIPGLRSSQPWTYVEAFSAKTLPKTLLVLGGGAVGLELAQAFARLGSKVTVLEAAERLLSAEDPEVSHALREYLEDEGIAVHTGLQVGAVRRDSEFQVITSSGNYAAEQLLVAAGRRPHTEGLGLQAAGVELGSRGEISVNARLETSNPRIFAAGDGAGFPQFVYVAAQSGRIAAKNALGGAEELDFRVVPRVTFTDPAVAAVGLSEEQARQVSGEGVRVARLPLRQLPKALVQHDDRGLFKLVVDREGKVLGLSVLAQEAGDALQEAVLAVKFGLNYQDLIQTYHPYLTLAEGIRLVAQALDTEVGKLSCCA